MSRRFQWVDRQGIRALFLAALLVCSAVGPASGVTAMEPSSSDAVGSAAATEAGASAVEASAIAVGHAPEPNLVDVDAPDSITIGESFEMTVSARNDGARAGHWSTLSVSSPNLDEYDDGSRIEIASQDLDYQTVAVRGEEIRTLQGTTTNAEYALAEAGTDGDAYWGGGERHQLSVEFTPEETGTFVVYVRATMTDEDDASEKFNDPASASTSDQQSYPVRRVVVTVEPEVDASVTSFRQESGEYAVGETVDATATVENTGGDRHTFFVGYSVRDPHGNWRDNDGATGETVTLDPGETRQVSLDWDVESDVPPGSYDSRVSVWKESDRDDLRTRLDRSDSFDEFGVETPVEGGEIVGYDGITGGAEYELDRWYDVSVDVKNTGDYEHTYTVKARTPSGTEVKDDAKTVTLDGGETRSVTFEQQWYGTYTDERSFTHDLYVQSGDGSEERVDTGSVTLTAPSSGKVTVAPNTADGEASDVDVTVRDAGSGEVVLRKTVANESLGIEAKTYTLEAGAYEMTATADDYRSRTLDFEVTEDKQTRVEPNLVPDGVDAAVEDGSFAVDGGAYEVGDHVNASVRVENTGDRSHEFFVGYSVRDEGGETYSQAGQTGQFVTLDPGETKTVELSWRVGDGVPTGSYDAVAAVWYGYPENGADRIENAGWSEDAFQVGESARSREVTYDGTAYTVEYRDDGTIVVYDEQRNAVDAETAEDVLQYVAFMRYSVSDPDDGWWDMVAQGESLNTHYWAGHMTQAAITAYKGYVRAHFGSYDDSLGEFVDLGVQASRAYHEQNQDSFSESVQTYSETTATSYELYEGQKDVATYAEFAQEAYQLKKSNEQADTMVDAIRMAEETDDGTMDPELQQVALSALFLPLDDVTAGLKVSQQQALVVVQWSKSSKPLLEMVDRLAEKRERGTITPREMRAYFVIQGSFFGSSARMANQVGNLQAHGKENSYAFDVLTAVSGGMSVEEAEQSRRSFQTLYGLKYEQLAQFESRADNLTSRAANIHDDPESGPATSSEPLSVTDPGWAEPGEPATVHVESRGKPVVNAEVTVGDRVVETDRNGDATFRLYEKDLYGVTVEKDGFESDTTVLQVREPEIVTRTFEDVHLGEIEGDDEVHASRTLTNTGEETLALESVSADHEGLEATANATTVEPGETLRIDVTVDPTEFESEAFSIPVTATWTTPEGETQFFVTSELPSADEPTTTAATTTEERRTTTASEPDGTTTRTPDTTGATATTRAADAPAQTANEETSVPGFGFGSALAAGAVAVALVLRRRRTR